MEFENRFSNKEVIFVTPELKSFKARSGGLGPAVEELANALSDFGLDIKVFSPLYRKFDKGDEFKQLDYDGLEFGDLGAINFQVAGEETPTQLKRISKEGVDFYFLENEDYAETLYYGSSFYFSIFLGKGVLEATKKLGLTPDIFHLNDPLTSLVGFYLRTDPNYSQLDSKIVYTIHNAGRGYQQIYDSRRFEELGVSREHFDGVTNNGKLNFAYAGIFHADKINTVSRDYQLKIKRKGLGLKEVLEKKELNPIINGINIDYWKIPFLKKGLWRTILRKRFPKEDLFRAKKKAKRLLIEEIERKTGKKLKEDEMIVVSPRRLAFQKGYENVIPLIKDFYTEGKRIQFIFLGVVPPDSPEGKHWRSVFEELSEKYERFVFIHEFNEPLAKKMYWGGDLLIYPSHPDQEPCGTGYMMSAVNGTPVLGTRTGGMAEEIKEFNEFSEKGNGFLVWEEEYGREAFRGEFEKILRIYYEKPEKWKEVCYNATKMDVDMERAAKEYIARLYEPLW